MSATSKRLDTVRRAAEISTQILRELYDATNTSVSPADLNKLAGELCQRAGVIPAFKDVPGPVSKFPGNLCISVNDEILHGIPSSGEKFKVGDLVKLDFGLIYEGYYTDHCVTVGIEQVSEEDRRLLEIGRLAVWSAVQKVKAGVAVGDLGYTMENIATMSGFNVLKGYVGHSIGTNLWGDLQIPAFGKQGKGPKVRAGDVLCIEAQIVAGGDAVFTAADGWTVKTRDRRRGVMFEYMVLATEKGFDVLTDTHDWELVK